MLIVACVLRPAVAAPSLGQILPRGGTRGTEIAVNFTGARLAGAQEILFHESGIAVTKLEQVSASHVRATLKIAADCPLGPHAMRVRTERGLSELRVFTVGALTELAEPEPNGDRTQAPKIALGTTVNGVIKSEDVDYYAFDVAAGQRINIEIEAVRLGGPLFDPRIAVLDAAGVELAAADDTCLVRQDAVIGHTFETAGTYVVEVRETAYGGGGNYHYRLHVGAFPRPLGVFPPGGKAGDKQKVTWLGDSAMVEGELQLPIAPQWPHQVFPQSPTGIAPSGMLFRVTAWPNVMEIEPNNGAAKATPMTTPAAANGIIDKPGDVDFYRFDGKKGQVLDVRVWARTLRSPLDPVLNIWQLTVAADKPAKLGKHLAGNDDSAGPDSLARITLPADGAYALRVRDHLARGGPLFTYRVEVAPPQPHLTLGRSPGDKPVRCVVPRGGRNVVLLSARRKDFSGPLKIAMAELPSGVTAEAPDMPGNVSVIPVLLTAAVDAPLAGAMVNVTGAHADPKKKIAGAFEQYVVTVYGRNKTVYDTHPVTRLPVAVVKEAPFSIEIAQPKVPIVRNGEMKLHVACKRAEGFDAPIALRMVWNPPGIGSARPNISKGKTEALLHLNANGRAAIGTWPIAVIATATHDGDTVEVSSQLATLEISDAWVAFGLKRTRVEQGHKTELTVTVTQKRDFEGTAKVELLGVPRDVKTAVLEMNKDTTELVFPIETTQKAPAGRHGGVFVRATIMSAGEPVVHRSGRGQLMIDKPLPAKSSEPVKPKPKKKRRRRPRRGGAAGEKP